MYIDRRKNTQDIINHNFQVRFLLLGTDTPWQKAEELGWKDKLALKVAILSICYISILRFCSSF
jgi:hypothetical protein